MSPGRLWLGDRSYLSSGFSLLLARHNEDIVSVIVKEIESLAVDPYIVEVYARIELKQIREFFISFRKLIWVDDRFLLGSRR